MLVEGPTDRSAYEPSEAGTEAGARLQGAAVALGNHWRVEGLEYLSASAIRITR